MTDQIERRDPQLRLAPADRMVIEVCAHAFAAVGEIDRAAVLWRRVAGLSAREGDFASRDRAVAALLHVNPDDETGLELLAQAHAQAGRLDESLAARQRLSELRRNKVRQTTPIPELATDPSGPSAPRAESDIMELSDADVMVIESSSAEIHGPHEGAESEDLLPTGPHAKRSPMGGAEVDSDSFAQPNAVTEQVTAVETLGNNTDPLQPSLQKDTETGSKPSPIAHGNREGSEVGTQPAIETQGLIDDLLDDLQGPQKGG